MSFNVCIRVHLNIDSSKRNKNIVSVMFSPCKLKKMFRHIT